eukprot:TRINITY_DN18_c0_g1_i2.p1 TRINITY_DN18_c0_g1~~TRINITY_DN18_c0_g1_i2.p1  ORF type:complete len:433 (-),score=61.70 TRINITY_DN18_c0_g1_i2:353-1555(-)
MVNLGSAVATALKVGINRNGKEQDKNFMKNMASILSSTLKFGEDIFQGGKDYTKWKEKLAEKEFWANKVMPAVIQALVVVIPNPVIGAALVWLQGVIQNIVVGKAESETDKMANLLRTEMQDMISNEKIHQQIAMNTNHLQTLQDEMDWIPNLLHVEANALENKNTKPEAYTSAVQLKMSWLLVVQHDMATSQQYMLYDDCMVTVNQGGSYSVHTSKELAAASDKCQKWQEMGTVFAATAYANLHLQIFNDMGLSNQQSPDLLDGLKAHMQKHAKRYKYVLSASAKAWKQKRTTDIGPTQSKWESAKCLCFLVDAGAAEVAKEKRYDLKIAYPKQYGACNQEKSGSCCEKLAKNKGCPAEGRNRIVQVVEEEAKQAETDVDNVVLAWKKASGLKDVVYQD